MGIAMAKVGSACPPQACHKTLRFPVDWPTEALTSQIQELLDLPLPDHPLPMSGAHHMLTSSAAQPALSVPGPCFPLPHHQASLTLQTSVLQGWVAGTLVSLTPVVPKPLPYSDLSLSFRFIASPHSWDVTSTSVAKSLFSFFVLILSQATGLRAYLANLAWTLGPPPHHKPLHVCLREALLGPLCVA